MFTECSDSKMSDLVQSSHIGEMFSVFVVQSFICSVLLHTHDIVEGISQAVSVGASVNSLVEYFHVTWRTSRSFYLLTYLL